MGLMTILLLCNYCFLSTVVSVPATDVDCDDRNIFEAVDAALTFHNNAKVGGNQFVLHRVTDAKIQKEEDSQIHYFVEYEIHEGSCAVKSAKTWKECHFQTHDPEWGKCLAHLHSDEEKIWDLVSQNCNSSKVPVESPVTAVHHQCLGCPRPIDTNSEEILGFVQTTIEHMNREGSHPYYFDLERILNATHQVVRGWNYNINFVVRETNCSKSAFKNKDPDQCKHNENGESGECRVQVSESPDGQINDIHLNCISQTGMCLNCPLKVDHQEPELLTFLNQLMDEYNSNSNHTELYSVSQVIDATKQAFYEQVHHVLFISKPTNCSKPDYTILGDECGITPSRISQSCDVAFNVTDNRINVLSNLQCFVLQTPSVRASGLSPLRRGRKPANQQTINLLKNVQKEQPLRGIGHGLNEKLKEGDNGKKEKKNKHSSTNDYEEVAPFQAKCPGKLWKPPIPTVKPFTDDDLVSANGNSISQSDKGEKNDPHTTKQSSSLNDEDLLLF